MAGITGVANGAGKVNLSNEIFDFQGLNIFFKNTSSIVGQNVYVTVGVATAVAGIALGIFALKGMDIVSEDLKYSPMIITGSLGLIFSAACRSKDTGLAFLLLYYTCWLLGAAYQEYLAKATKERALEFSQMEAHGDDLKTELVLRLLNTLPETKLRSGLGRINEYLARFSIDDFNSEKLKQLNKNLLGVAQGIIIELEKRDSILLEEDPSNPDPYNVAYAVAHYEDSEHEVLFANN